MTLAPLFPDWFHEKAYIEERSRHDSFPKRVMATEAAEPFVDPPVVKRKKQGKGTSKKKKLDFQGMIQTTLDRWLFKPRTPTRVRFKERVLLKVMTPSMERWTTVPLKGFSDPYSAFAIKRLEMKRSMARQHRVRRDRPTARNVRKVTHILKRLLRENTKLGY